MTNLTELLSRIGETAPEISSDDTLGWQEYAFSLESLVARLAARVERAEAIIDDAESYLHGVVSATTACTDMPLRLDERVATLVEWCRDGKHGRSVPMHDGHDKCRICEGWGSYDLDDCTTGESEEAHTCERCNGTGREPKQ